MPAPAPARRDPLLLVARCGRSLHVDILRAIFRMRQAGVLPPDVEVKMNPLAGTADSDAKGFVTLAPGAQEVAEFRRRLAQGCIEYGDVAWLRRREHKGQAREDELRLNWRFSVDTGMELDMGPITPAWAFVFKMGQKDHKAPKATFEARKTYEDKDMIPLEAWQICHRLWKHDFHITHYFSTLGNLLIILVGLPYKTLVVSIATSCCRCCRCCAVRCCDCFGD